jgi:Tol biopolymer transport system component
VKSGKSMKATHPVQTTYQADLQAFNGLVLAWSPDGSKFVFSTADGLFSLDHNGTNQTQLTHDLTRITNIAWSPDSQQIAFLASASRQIPPNLFTIRADGSSLVNLTNSNLGGQFRFSWSSDGDWLVYDSAKDTGHGNIFISNADGSQQY